MRMTASWSGSTDPTAYKSVARKMCPNGELPSDSQQTDLQVPTRHRGMRKARLAVHHRSACSGVKALRNTSPLGGRPLLPFRSLDPFRPLREPDRRRRNEERLSRSEQRTGNKPKIRLDRKSPIQVRIHLPPAKSRANQRLLGSGAHVSHSRRLSVPLRWNNGSRPQQAERRRNVTCDIDYECIGEPNSTSRPSPVVLTMRPLCAAIVGSNSSARMSFNAERVPLSPVGA